LDIIRIEWRTSKDGSATRARKRSQVDRGLVHFSAEGPHFADKRSAEKMDLSPSRGSIVTPRRAGYAGALECSMLLGPIFSVELVTGARRARYYILRVVYAGVLLVALSVAYLQTAFAGSSALANATAGFFTAFAVLQVLAVLAIGPAMAAGTVALERQRRTIEYLFCSPLSNAEILLSKLAARLVQLAGLVLAGLPVLALAMMLGGIAPEALLVVMAITASTLASLTMLSIAVSAWAPRAQDAVVRVYLLLLVLLLAPWFLSWLPPLPGGLAWLGWLNDQLVAANPLWVLSNAFSAASSREAAAALAMVARMIENQMLAAAAALSVAIFVVRRLHLKQAGAPPRRWLWRLQFLRPAVGDRPMLWKELFAEAAAARLGALGWGTISTIAVGVVGTALYLLAAAVADGQSPAADTYVAYALWIVGVTGFVGALAAGVRAAVSITSEKERGCWDNLLTSPLGPAEIFFAKVLGSLWALRGVALLQAVLLAPAVFLRPITVIFAAISVGVCLFLAAIATTLGAAVSLRARNSSQALAATLGILVAYLVLSACCCSLIGVVGGTVGIILVSTLSISNFDRITGRAHFDPRTFRTGSPFRTVDALPPDAS
jgi:ABC-type transport system involved in multi-copper enzyme maturation permease subunit